MQRKEQSLDPYKATDLSAVRGLSFFVHPLHSPFIFFSVLLFSLLSDCMAFQLPWQMTRRESMSYVIIDLCISHTHTRTHAAAASHLVHSDLLFQKDLTKCGRRRKKGRGGKEQQLKDNYLLEKGHNFHKVFIAVRRTEEERQNEWIPPQRKCQTLALTFCYFLVVLLAIDPNPDRLLTT